MEFFDNCNAVRFSGQHDFLTCFLVISAIETPGELRKSQQPTHGVEENDEDEEHEEAEPEFIPPPKRSKQRVPEDTDTEEERPEKRGPKKRPRNSLSTQSESEDEQSLNKGKGETRDDNTQEETWTSAPIKQERDTVTPPQTQLNLTLSGEVAPPSRLKKEGWSLMMMMNSLDRSSLYGFLTLCSPLHSCLYLYLSLAFFLYLCM